MRVALFATCLVDTVAPQVAMATARLLERLGHEVVVPAGQACCGQMHVNTGYRREAVPIVANHVRAFAGAEAIVSPSGSCVASIHHQQAMVLRRAGEDELAAEAEALAERTHELSQFLVKRLGRHRFRSVVGGRLTYHDSCHLLRGLHESQSPRALLRGLAGAEFVELPGADECCGFGGSFSVRLPEVSAAILDKKLASVEATGADCVVACDAGCLMQMRGGLSRRGSRVRAVHLAEVLGELE